MLSVLEIQKSVMSYVILFKSSETAQLLIIIFWDDWNIMTMHFLNWITLSSEFLTQLMSIVIQSLDLQHFQKSF